MEFVQGDQAHGTGTFGKVATDKGHHTPAGTAISYSSASKRSLARKLTVPHNLQKELK